MEEIRYTDEAAMKDLIAQARNILDTVCAKGIEVSISALPDNGKHAAFVTVNVGEYTYTEFYRDGDTLVNTETRQKIQPKDVVLVRG